MDKKLPRIPTRINEHDEYIKLQERYKTALQTAAYFRDEYNKLFDWINEYDPDLLTKYNDESV